MGDAAPPPYEVILHPKAERDLKRLPPTMGRRILEAALRLGVDPYPPGKKVKRLLGVDPPAYRLRVGRYRALYRVHEATRRVSCASRGHPG